MMRTVDHYRNKWNGVPNDAVVGFVEHIHTRIAAAIAVRETFVVPNGGYLMEHAESATQFDAALRYAGEHFQDIGFDVEWIPGHTYIKGRFTAGPNVNLRLSGWAK